MRNVSKYLDKNYKQTVDIDLTGIDMAPISTELVNNTYNGNFTGVYKQLREILSIPVQDVLPNNIR